jgi:hypothetical protein
MRSVIATLALAGCLLGCGSAPVGLPAPLLTGVDGCWAGGETGLEGPLLVHPEYGTTFHDMPVMWPVGFTGVRLARGEVAVLDADGKVVATTGRTYFISRAPVWNDEKHRLMEQLGAFPAAANCGYPWDLKEINRPLGYAGVVALFVVLGIAIVAYVRRHRTSAPRPRS